MTELSIIIAEAQSRDGVAIAEVYLAAQAQAMPYLRKLHTDQEMRDYFSRVVGDRPLAWWVIRKNAEVVAYMLNDGENLDHLYVAPSEQGFGFGTALLTKAKQLSPGSLKLRTFRRNQRARTFYEARGFEVAGETNGENEEAEPDVLYEWVKRP